MFKKNNNNNNILYVDSWSWCEFNYVVRTCVQFDRMCLFKPLAILFKVDRLASFQTADLNCKLEIMATPLHRMKMFWTPIVRNGFVLFYFCYQNWYVFYSLLIIVCMFILCFPVYNQYTSSLSHANYFPEHKYSSVQFGTLIL